MLDARDAELESAATALAEWSRTQSEQTSWACEEAATLAMEQLWDDLWWLTLRALDQIAFEEREAIAILAAGPLESLVRYAADVVEERIVVSVASHGLLAPDHPLLVRIARQLADEARRLHEHVQSAAVAGHDREDEIQLLFGARDGDVEKAALFFLAGDDDFVLGRCGVFDDLGGHLFDRQIGCPATNASVSSNASCSSFGFTRTMPPGTRSARCDGKRPSASQITKTMRHSNPLA